MNPHIEQAFRQWLANEAYIDGHGNYHTKGSHVSGPIAPWNKTVKRLYPTAHDLHQAAHTWQRSLVCHRT